MKQRLKLPLTICTALVLLFASGQPASSQSGDDYTCGELTTVQMPFSFVFIPDGAESSDPVTSWWVVGNQIETLDGQTINMYDLEGQYLRIWMPVFDPTGGDLWGYTAPILVSVADYEVVASCESALPTPTQTPALPTQTPRPTPTPTAIPTSPINHILTSNRVPWATECGDASTACLPYHLSIDDLPAAWQPHAVKAAALWAEAIPQLQFTHGPIDPLTRTLVPYGVNDWMPGQPLGNLRLAVGEIRIVPESALSPVKLDWRTVALGIPYHDQTRLKQAVAGLIIIKEDPPLFLHWGFDGKPGRAKLDLQTLIAHELGHVLGICGHDMDPGCDENAEKLPREALMYSYEADLPGIVRNGLPRRDLHALDIELMTTLYPTTDFVHNLVPTPTATSTSRSRQSTHTPTATPDARKSELPDKITHALRISAIPSTITIDLEKTSASDTDPAICAGEGTQSLWFLIEATSQDIILVDTLGSTYDTVLTIYSGNPDNLEAIECNDDYGDSTTSRVTLFVQEDRHYYVLITSYSLSQGMLALNVARVSDVHDWWTDRPMLTQSEIATTARVMDLSHYCRSLGLADAHIPDLNDIWGWSCRDVQGETTSINLDDVCRKQVSAIHEARYHDPYSAYSWACVQTNNNQLTIVDYAEEILIPAGSFQMGCSPNDSQCDGDEYPLHTVDLEAYYIDKYEVTNARYQQCVNEGDCTSPGNWTSYNRSSYFGNPQYDNYPVVNINWYQADAFCAWEGKRLPTEAEWEKAARGTDERIYPWGNQSPNATLLNHAGSAEGTTPVGSYPAGASPYGVMDMAGNVYEWVNDRYQSDYYNISPTTSPLGPNAGDYRVLRGGSWFFSEIISGVRSTDRDNQVPSFYYFVGDGGFRCARSVKSADAEPTHDESDVLPQDISEKLTSYTLTEQPGDDFLCLGPCPKLCRFGCDSIHVTHVKLLDITTADQANGIEQKWCAEVQLIAKDEDNTWVDKRIYYEITQSKGQINIFEGSIWVPDMGITPVCR